MMVLDARCPVADVRGGRDSTEERARGSRHQDHPEGNDRPWRQRPPPEGRVATHPARQRQPVHAGHGGAHGAGHGGGGPADPHAVAARAFREDPGDRLRLRRAGHRPLPRQLLRAARQHRDGLPSRSGGDHDARRPRPACGAARSGAETTGPDPRHRHRGVGQEHHAGQHGRHHQHRVPQPRDHHRGSHRVPAQGQAEHHQPAGGRRGHRQLQRRAQVHPAAGPGRDPHRRDPRRRIDEGGAHGRRHGASGALDHAHHRRHADRQPHHQLLSAPPAPGDPLPAGEHPAVGHLAAAGAPTPPTSAASRPSRS